MKDKGQRGQENRPLVLGNRMAVVFVLLAFLIYSFVFLRCFFSGLKRYQLNKSAIKKRAKEETLKEWLIYSKYRDVIPKMLIVLYLLILCVHIGAVIVCCILLFTGDYYDILRAVTLSIVGFDFIWGLGLKLLYWDRGPGWAYERWISKKCGMKPVKKKGAKGRW